jgi:hypothetical protein
MLLIHPRWTCKAHQQKTPEARRIYEAMTTLDPLDQMMKSEEAAEWLRMKLRDYIKKCRTGVIPAFRVGERQMLCHPRTVIAKLADDAEVKPEVIAASLTLPPTKPNPQSL